MYITSKTYNNGYSEIPEIYIPREINFVTGLTMHNVETVGHCAELLRMGIANRITSATTMNAHSSRLVLNSLILDQNQFHRDNIFTI